MPQAVPSRPGAGAGFEVEPESRQQRVVNVLTWFKERFRLSNEDLGNAIGVERETVSSWLNRHTTPQKSNYRTIIDLKKIKQYAESIFEDTRTIETWFEEPSDYFELNTPLEVLLEGDVERVLDVLATFHQGGYV